MRAPLRLPGIEGRRVLVTGGSRGIGRATAVWLAEAGALVGIAYRRAHAAASSTVEAARAAAARRRSETPETGEEGPAEASAAASAAWCEAADLTREDEVVRLFERVDAEFGGLDGFVGNAGIWNDEDRPLEALAADEWREMVEVNLTSIYRTTREAVARMDSGGRVVLLSSTAAQRGEAMHSHYAATKGAVNAFCKSLAVELGPRGITVNAVAPGWVDTDMAASVLRTDRREEIVREIPVGRVASAEDVAGPILFLLSDLGRHVTGEVLNVNGGSVLCG